ncbi:hypothetical protein [Auraticoccus monumenti]|uniref:hypothetical protein n=1 Tax=Auraticoccus monumenti TaxID=675864 RepID=UPI000B80C658|nr:hypothetical protein [Auraticoccus monumenti]
MCAAVVGLVWFVLDRGLGFGSSTDPPVVQRAGGSTLIAAAEEPETYMLALAGGVLTRTERGCLAFDVGDAGGVTVLQLPFGTVLTDDGRSVVVPDHGTVHLGDTFTAGGGFGRSVDAYLPEECRGGSSLFVWQ